MPGPPSALVGLPPLTHDDREIIHGFNILLGHPNLDPSKGLILALKRPPPGQDDGNLVANLAAGCAISLFLMTVFTGTRLSIRASRKCLAWGLDDWAIIVATNAGAGKHVYDVTYWELANFKTVSTAIFACFWVAIAAIKISLILFYMRLTAFTSRTWTIAHRTFIIVLVLCAIVSVIVSAFQCNPTFATNVREISRTGIQPKCIPTLNLVIGLNIWNILADCLLLVVPFMMLWRVQMKQSTKLKVCIAGVIGFANIGFAIGRTVAQAKEQDKVFDLTHTGPTTFMYSATELTLGIFTANIPVLSALVTKGVEMLSWSSVSRDGSPDSSEDKRSKVSKFYERRIHDDSKPGRDIGLGNSGEGPSASADRDTESGQRDEDTDPGGCIPPAHLTPQQLAAFRKQPHQVQQKSPDVYNQNLEHNQPQQNTPKPLIPGNDSPAMQPGMDLPMNTEYFANNLQLRAGMPNGNGVSNGGNLALQDYQEKLMLLEQENKRRLLIARQG
ncbi:MAG: hypothetical protein Q9218_007323 [Villophora microphyllina]